MMQKINENMKHTLKSNEKQTRSYEKTSRQKST